MSEPLSSESPKPGVERSTAGLIVALYIGAALLLLYLTYQVLTETTERLAPPDSAALVSPASASLVATRLSL